jgi:uncharacterized membrane protein YtjA (UPF0391 family)
MLRLALLFLVVALVAALFGFTGMASAFAGVAQIIFYIFLALLLFALIAGLLFGRSPTNVV